VEGVEPVEAFQRLFWKRGPAARVECVEGVEDFLQLFWKSTARSRDVPRYRFEHKVWRVWNLLRLSAKLMHSENGVFYREMA
jgi:hypothetical protein